MGEDFSFDADAWNSSDSDGRSDTDESVTDGQSAPDTAPIGVKIYCVLVGFGLLANVLRVFGLMTRDVLGLLLGFLVLGLYVVIFGIIAGIWQLDPKAWKWNMALIAFGGVSSLVTLNLTAVAFAVLWGGYFLVKADLYEPPSRSGVAG